MADDVGGYSVNWHEVELWVLRGCVKDRRSRSYLEQLVFSDVLFRFIAQSNNFLVMRRLCINRSRPIRSRIKSVRRDAASESDASAPGFAMHGSSAICARSMIWEESPLY